MRLYELARDLGVSTEQVKVWAAPITYSNASQAVTTRDEEVIRKKAAAAGNTPQQPAVPALLSKEAVQKAIDQIVEQYGWDWCGDGVTEVNEILNPLGLTVTRFYDNGHLNITVQASNVPSGEDFETALANKIKEVITDFQWNGRNMTLRPGRYGEDPVSVSSEED
jgi:hypothetical protein